jgi:CBS domain-containing protein
VTAKDIMTTEVITATPRTTVGEIAALLTKHGIAGLPVVDEERRVLGVVTEADLVVRSARPHFPHYIQLLDGFVFLESPKRFDEEVRKIIAMSAEEIMTKEVVTCAPDASVEDVATLMVDRNINRIIVVENDRLVGIVTRADIVKTLRAEEAPPPESGGASPA